jgi:hypothetical protein
MSPLVPHTEKGMNFYRPPQENDDRMRNFAEFSALYDLSIGGPALFPIGAAREKADLLLVPIRLYETREALDRNILKGGWESLGSRLAEYGSQFKVWLDIGMEHKGDEMLFYEPLNCLEEVRAGFLDTYYRIERGFDLGPAYRAPILSDYEFEVDEPLSQFLFQAGAREARAKIRLPVFWERGIYPVRAYLDPDGSIALNPNDTTAHIVSLVDAED